MGFYHSIFLFKLITFLKKISDGNTQKRKRPKFSCFNVGIWFFTIICKGKKKTILLKVKLVIS